MNRRYIRYVFAALSLLAMTGCEGNEPNPAGNSPVQVVLHLSSTQPQTVAQPELRAARPMPPANENPIYGIWLLQFDAEGIIIDRPVYYPCDELGELSTTLTPTLRAGQSTVCAVANVGEDFEFKIDGRDVDNLTSFRAMLVDAPLVVTEEEAGEGHVGHLREKSMYLYGYFQGVVQEDRPLTVMLGRLFLRVNMQLQNHTGAAIDRIKVRIDNVPAKTRIPFVDQPLETGMFTSYEEEVLISGGLAPGNSTTRYYYMPENVSPAQGNATRVTVEAGGRSASVELGNDSPDTPDRDCSLNRNNIYTFRLRLK